MSDNSKRQSMVNSDGIPKLYFMPVNRNGTHFLRFHAYKTTGKEAQIKHAEKLCKHWASPILSYHVFLQIKARPQGSDRSAAYRAWLLRVWKVVTGKELPSPKEDSVSKQKASTRSEPPKNRNLDEISKISDEDMQYIKSLETPNHALFKKTSQTVRSIPYWKEFSSGNTDSIVNDDAALRNMRGHYRAVHLAIPPPLEVMRSAYVEMKSTGAVRVTETHAWEQWLASRVGSVDTITVTQPKYASTALPTTLEAAHNVIRNMLKRAPNDPFRTSNAVIEAKKIIRQQGDFARWDRIANARE